MSNDSSTPYFTPSVEVMQRFLPYYLTKEQKSGLTRDLKNFDTNRPFYMTNTTLYGSDFLQGDGWTKLVIANLDTGQRKEIRGILLSNSCDISPENKRDLPTNVTFAPIIEVDRFKNLLVEAQLDQKKIDNKLACLRDQAITNIFYLPPGGPLNKEHVALLDSVQSMPTRMIQENLNGKKLFTLDTLGFYVFVMKLSIHFCRLHENVSRQ